MFGDHFKSCPLLLQSIVPKKGILSGSWAGFEPEANRLQPSLMLPPCKTEAVERFWREIIDLRLKWAK
jgi:hypothetical protein